MIQLGIGFIESLLVTLLLVIIHLLIKGSSLQEFFYENLHLIRLLDRMRPERTGGQVAYMTVVSLPNTQGNRANKWIWANERAYRSPLPLCQKGRGNLFLLPRLPLPRTPYSFSLSPSILPLPSPSILTLDPYP